MSRVLQSCHAAEIMFGISGKKRLKGIIVTVSLFPEIRFPRYGAQILQ